MVNPITAVILGGIVLVALGSGIVGKASAAISGNGNGKVNGVPVGDKVTTQKATQIIQSEAPELQIASITSLSGSGVIRTGIVLEPTPLEEFVINIEGIAGAQFSTGAIGILTDAERIQLIQEGFTPEEILQIEAFDLRKEQSESGALKLSGIEQVIALKEQELLSKKFIEETFGADSFVCGKLFANPDFFSPEELQACA